METGEKQNILNLIGRDSRRYTSCLITSFSFDFLFFEERLMPRLKAAGIRNFNLLLDGNYYEQLLEKSEGNTFQHQKTYSIIPVYQQGVYHPKIMLLTGPRHGLLIIGSGNLSASGLSTNDEVWGAFHLDAYKSQNAPLFAEAWQYLSGSFSAAKGFNKEKLEWIAANSPWLLELEFNPNTSFIPIHKKQEVCFIANKPDNSIYQQLKALMPAARLKKLTVIAPYYDKNGQAVRQLVADYKPENVCCITDCTFGLLPTELPEASELSRCFYNWKDCVKEFNSKHHRLHAKLFHFEFEDGWEYLMVGSANATMAALGTATHLGRNSEAGLLLRRQKNKQTYIQELKISVDEAERINLSEHTRHDANRGDSLATVDFEVRILHAELADDRLKLYLQHGWQGSCNIILFNSQLKELDRQVLPENVEYVELTLINKQNASQLALFSGEKRISNYCPIHHTAILAKSNPDPKQAQISEILEGIQEQKNGDEFVSLLNYINTNWADDQHAETNSRTSFNFSSRVRVEEVKEYRALDEATFNSLPSVQQSEHSLLNNPTVQAADILSMLSKELLLPKDGEATESAEELLSQENVENQTGEGEAVEEKFQDNNQAEKERQVIHNYIKTIEGYFEERLVKFYKSGSLLDMPSSPVTVTELSHVLILAKLLYKFIGKQYSEKKIAISINYFEKYGKSIKKIIDKYKVGNQVKVVDGVSTTYKQEFFVSISDVDPCIEELNEIDVRIYNEVDINRTQSVISRYFGLSPYRHAHSDAIKAILIDALGTVLLSVSSKAGFKEYPYNSVNEKVKAYRKLTFYSLTYLILSIEWRQDEYDCRNLLLLDLLYKLWPQHGVSASEIVQEVKLLHEESPYKSNAFPSNLEWYAGFILSPYQQWTSVYADPELKGSLVKDKDLVRLGSVIFRSELGFASVQSKGEDFLLLKKPGFYSNDDFQGFPIQKIQYQRNKLVTMPALQ